MRNLIPNSAILASFIVFLFAPVMALQDERPSAVFTVDEASDALDVVPGDGICADSVGNCTLRAAVTEANFTTAPDTITFVDDLASIINLTARTAFDNESPHDRRSRSPKPHNPTNSGPQRLFV